MMEIAVYGLIIVFLVALLIGKILYQRFFNSSIKAKKINPDYERRVQWQFIISYGICGLASGLFGILIRITESVVSPNFAELLLMTIIIAICFSLFGWIGFWMINALLRARIKMEIQRETDNNKTS